MSDDASRTRDPLASQVRDFYERHPYPPPGDDITAYRLAWNEDRRRADSHLFWPFDPYRNNRSVLVAGCGTRQAAHYASRWPNARVVGIDVSETSLAVEGELKKTHRLDNLELRTLSVERSAELNETFAHVVCTGVLHHLADPEAGLRALREVLAESGTLHLMVYAPYGRAGIYILQEYCRRLGLGTTEREVRDLATTLKALPAHHPIVPLLRNSPDFATTAGLADALLHPNDRSYSVPELLDLLDRTGFVFGRWIRQAPYHPLCGAIASTPHAKLLSGLAPYQQYAAMELFRGTMVRHSVVAYASSHQAQTQSVDFQSDAWVRYVPLRLPESVAIRENVPSGFSAVLINRNHAFTDLYLPVSAQDECLLDAADGKRTIADIAGRLGDSEGARSLFYRLWLWDQVLLCR